MAKILYTNGFFGSVQMRSLSVNNSVMNISRLGTFKKEVLGRLLAAVGRSARV
jgi:hypothetical protein